MSPSNGINFLKSKNGAEHSGKFGRPLFVAIFILLLLAIAAPLIVFLQLPARTIAQGVTIGSFAVGGMTGEQAANLLTSQAANLEEQGLSLIFNDQTVKFKSTAGDAVNLELAYQIFDYQIEESLASALAVGRAANGSLADQWLERLRTRFFGQRLPFSLVFDDDRAKQFLKDEFGKFETSYKEAAFLAVFDDENSPDFEVEVLPESPGAVLSYDQLVGQIKNQLAGFILTPINLRLAEQWPSVSAAAILNLKEDFERLLRRGSLIFVSEDKKFVMPPATFAKWLVIVKGEPGQPARLDLSREALARSLQEMAKEVEVPAKEQKMEIINGRVAEFQPFQIGRKINESQMYNKVKAALLEADVNREIALVVDKIEPPRVTLANADLGIKELIGVAKTSFQGSPTNRRFNIKQGAASLNGVLIRPGQVFSTIEVLGKIDREHGYRSELVIKNNKTTPEFGGGLCQVSTTLFSSVLAAGLPVTERRNHSYRVRYYEPAGLDATIYSPRPDFKFLNDTGHYVLVQTRITGNDLIFELWGTKDGRVAETTKPRIYNIVPPPEPKLIATTDLPIGKKNCTEIAHAGADSIFSYTVNYTDGTVKKQDFRSHYKPWGEVCFIGSTTPTLTSVSP
jgi:vancomycin resistance protein YoaR